MHRLTTTLISRRIVYLAVMIVPPKKSTYIVCRMPSCYPILKSVTGDIAAIFSAVLRRQGVWRCLATIALVNTHTRYLRRTREATYLMMVPHGRSIMKTFHKPGGSWGLLCSCFPCSCVAQSSVCTGGVSCCPLLTTRAGLIP